MWGDQEWELLKAESDPYHSPLLIYELHAGSWKRDDQNLPISYRVLASQLIPYVKELAIPTLNYYPWLNTHLMRHGAIKLRVIMPQHLAMDP